MSNIKVIKLISGESAVSEVKETDDGYVVKAGLKQGEVIVLSGNFLLDSESRVQAQQGQGEAHE